mmetsp:Transcript_76677/g.127757  ORF Transcript_76677/g.127757 Transcript_76677/m.127757 type:complete len:202 (-) Transcript_76677:298-903(-)
MGRDYRCHTPSPLSTCTNGAQPSKKAKTGPKSRARHWPRDGNMGHTKRKRGKREEGADRRIGEGIGRWAPGGYSITVKARGSPANGPRRNATGPQHHRGPTGGGGHVKRASPGTGALCAPPRAAARGLLLVVILQQFALDGPQEARRDLVVVAVPRVLGLDDGDAAVLAGEADEVLPSVDVQTIVVEPHRRDGGMLNQHIN